MACVCGHADEEHENSGYFRACEVDECQCVDYEEEEED